jgi:hypothetical protein
MYILQYRYTKFNKQRNKSILIKDKECRRFFTAGCYEEKRVNEKYAKLATPKHFCLFYAFFSIRPSYILFCFSYVSVCGVSLNCFKKLRCTII